MYFPTIGDINMKAKDYKELFIKLKQDEHNFTMVGIVTDILLQFQKEIFKMTELRKCKSDAACIGVIIELNQKWLSFVDTVQEPDIDKSLFIFSIKKIMPDLYTLLPDNLKEYSK